MRTFIFCFVLPLASSVSYAGEEQKTVNLTGSISDDGYPAANVVKVNVRDINDSDFRDGSIFINAGGSITPATEWFIEARGIDSDNPDGNDAVDDNRSFNAGIRLLFR